LFDPDSFSISATPKDPRADEAWFYRTRRERCLL
jgi:hypothetical protein